ncbi:MAG: hypothetical protein ABIO55_15065 [Ginsengibacter sp.]
MKKIIAGLIVITAITFSANAQTTGNKSDQSVKEHEKSFHQKGHKQWAEKLQLTNDQKQHMKTINSDFKSKMTSLKKSNLSADELKAKRESLVQDRKQKTMALLTAEQKDKLGQLSKEHRGQGKMDGAKRMEKMKESLAFSDDQAAKLNAQKEAFKTKAEAIKNNEALSADQKNEQLKALREERKNEFKNILTPDQVKKMEEMKHKRTGKSA